MTVAIAPLGAGAAARSRLGRGRGARGSRASRDDGRADRQGERGSATVWVLALAGGPRARWAWRSCWSAPRSSPGTGPAARPTSRRWRPPAGRSSPTRTPAPSPARSPRANAAELTACARGRGRRRRGRRQRVACGSAGSASDRGGPCPGRAGRAGGPRRGAPSDAAAAPPRRPAASSSGIVVRADPRRRPARRGRRRARAPPRPCPAGRCRCRTWATARRTGSRSRTRSWPTVARVACSHSPQHREAALAEAGTAGVPVVDEDRRRAGVGVQRGREPAEVPAVAGRQQRQDADRRVLGGVQRAGQLAPRRRSARSTARSSRVSHTARVRSWRAGRSSGNSASTSPVPSRRRW